MYRYYLEIIKPGIIIGNIILIIGSFLFASHIHDFNLSLFFYTILGTSLVIASSCVFNNLIDSDIDKKMIRTKYRALSKNLLDRLSAFFFGSILGIFGFVILGFLVNYLSMLLSIFGFFVYVILYTFFYKRTSVYSTFIGSFSGSIPSVIGYTSVTNTIDLFSILLFIIFIFWQMSHFYAISILRINDYKSANIPVFPVVKGIYLAKKHILYYIICFIISTSLLTFFGYLSYIFLFLSSIINLYWLFLSVYDIQEANNIKSSSQLFYCSIFVVVIFNFLLSIDSMF